MIWCSETDFFVIPWSITKVSYLVIPLIPNTVSLWKIYLFKTDGDFPDNYYLCLIHSHTYIYNSVASTFCDYQSIYLHRVFYRTSIVEIIIYM